MGKDAYSSSDLPGAQLYPSLKEYSKGISELCGLLAGKINVLKLPYEKKMDSKRLDMLKNTLTILHEDGVILKPLRASVVEMKRIRDDYDRKMPKKEDNTPQPKANRVELVKSPLTNKPKTIPSIIQAIVEYSKSFGIKAHYYSMMPMSKTSVAEVKIQEDLAKWYIEELEEVRRDIKELIEKMESPSSSSGK